MSDEYTTIHEVPTAGGASSITIINNNFQVLTKRIKNLNLSISYLDLIHITDIYEVNQTDPNEALAAFVRTQWTVLGNYDGICITDNREDVTDPILFTFQGHTIQDGDYLVKLPDGQCVYIQNEATAEAYFPTAYNAATGIITWKLQTVSTASSASQMTLATIPQSGGLSYASGFCSSGTSFTPSGTLRSTRWYTDDGEEVLWSHSYCTNTNSSGLNLNYSAIMYTISDGGDS